MPEISLRIDELNLNFKVFNFMPNVFANNAVYARLFQFAAAAARLATLRA
jgi:hypothetical protein